MMKRILYFILFLAPLCVWAQGENPVYPSVSPLGTFTTSDGEEIEDASDGQSAPLVARFTANPSDVGSWAARYEWKIYRQGEKNVPIVHRFEEDIEYTFSQSGTFYVQLYATFVNGTDTIAFPEEGDENPIVVNISESKLEFPNAFSPNKEPDGFNDYLKAKEDHQSIVSFQAAVFSRWGQKIYSWTDINGGWDGRWNGHLVKDGVYFLVVNAKGADGRKYNIRKAITVITGHSNDSLGTTSGEE